MNTQIRERSVGSPMLLRLEEAQDLLRIGRAHLYRLLERGDLRSVHIGAARRIRYDEVQRFVAQLEARSAETDAALLNMEDAAASTSAASKEIDRGTSTAAST